MGEHGGSFSVGLAMGWPGEEDAENPFYGLTVRCPIDQLLTGNMPQLIGIVRSNIKNPQLTRRCLGPMDRTLYAIDRTGSLTGNDSVPIDRIFCTIDRRVIT